MITGKRSVICEVSELYLIEHLKLAVEMAWSMANSTESTSDLFCEWLIQTASSEVTWVATLDASLGPESHAF